MRRPLAALTATVLLSSILTATGASAAPAPVGDEQPPGSVAVPGDHTTDDVITPLPLPETTLQVGKAKGRERYLVQFSSPAVPSRKLAVAEGDRVPSKSSHRRELRSEQRDELTRMRRTLGRSPEVLHTFTEAVNGAVVELTATEARKVARIKGVTSVIVDGVAELQTDRGPGTIGAPWIWDGSSDTEGVGTQGEGIVVGIIDSGINPLNPSFAASVPVSEGGDGYVHTNPNGAGNYLGMCDPTSPAYEAAFTCNDKLIGAWKYTTTGGIFDNSGHGSHTASTTAGNRVRVTVGEGDKVQHHTISGVAPHANVISYDVCDPSCPYTATLAAVDQAILDGVDVINYSIGGATPTANWGDLAGTAMRNARAAGIHVAQSAGNRGNAASTLAGSGDLPWVTSVASVRNQRVIKAQLLDIAGANGTTLPAFEGLTSMHHSPVTGTLVNGGTCNWSLTAAVAFDKIVVCPTTSRADADYYANERGAKGVVFVNAAGSTPFDRNRSAYLSSIELNSDDSTDLLALLGETTVTARLGKAYSADDPRTSVSAYSSRGPNRFVDVVGPHVAAPGEQVLAAGGTNGSVDHVFMSGTSMASPHVAGALALLADLHPDWTPAQLQSALMTTAIADSLNGATEAATRANAFDVGSGRIDVGRAHRAGLLLDVTAAQYDAANPLLGGDARTLNLPSMSSQACVVTCSWSRRVTATPGNEGAWTTRVESTPALEVTVPQTVTVTAGRPTSLPVSARLTAAIPATPPWHHATLVLTPPAGSDAPEVRMPIAVKGAKGRVPASVALNTRRNSSSGAPIYETDTTSTATVRALATPTIRRGVTSPSNDVYTVASTAIVPVTVAADTVFLRVEVTSDAPVTESDLDLYVGSPTPTSGTKKCTAATYAATEICTVVRPTAGAWQIGIHNYFGPADTPFTLAITQVRDTTDSTVEFVDATARAPRLQWNDPTMAAGDVRHSLVTATIGGVGRDIPVTIRREADDVARTSTPATPGWGDEVTHTVTLTPEPGDTDQVYSLAETLPAGTLLVAGSFTATPANGTVPTVSGTSVTWDAEFGAGDTAPRTFTYRTKIVPGVPDGTQLTHTTRHSTTRLNTVSASTSSSVTVQAPAAPTAAPLASAGPGARTVTVPTSAHQTVSLPDASLLGKVIVTGGTYTLDGAAITFTPDAGFSGSPTPVDYVVADPAGRTARSTFSPQVWSAAPSPVDLTTTGHGAQAVTVPLAPDAMITLLDAQSNPTMTHTVAAGSYSVSASGQISFVPDAGFHGTADPVTYRIIDQYGQTGSATYTPTVKAPAPTASDLTSRGHGDHSVTVTLQPWQTLGLLDGSTVRTSVTVPAGEYTVDGQKITFTPAAGFHGTATPITFRISDVYGQSADATFTPTVFAPAPTATAKTSRGHGAGEVTIALETWQSLRLLDADGNPATTVTVDDGTYTVTGSIIRFTPESGFHGEADPVTYRISDIYDQSADATFTPTVLADAPVGSALTARGHGPQTVTLTLASWQTLGLVDADGNPATTVTVTGGTYTVTGATITFTPSTGFHGTPAPVTYRVADIYLQRFDATFTPTVVPAVPVAENLTSRGHGTLNATVSISGWQTLGLLDADGDPATRVNVTGGTYTVAGATITFTPDAGFHGEAAPVTYRISDTYHQSDDATFTPTVLAPAPTATAKTSRGHGNRVVTIDLETWQSLRLLDADGDPATSVTVAGGAYTRDGARITFTPDAGFHGAADPVTYRIADLYGQTDSATFTPTVLPAEPEAAALTSRGHGNRTVTVPLKAWQTLVLMDAAGNPATTVTGTGGIYSVDGDEITFTPGAGFHGAPYRVVYRISDTYNQSDDATFTPTVFAPAPTATAKTARGHGNQSVTIDLELWQTLRLLDAEGDPAATVTVDDGTYSVTGNVITFTPDADFHGEADPVTYQIADSYGQSVDATFTPTVLAPAPTATAKTSRGHGDRTVTIDLEAWQTLRLLDADGDPATTVTVASGTYTVTGARITFTPDARFHGEADPITFRIADLYGQSDDATFTPTVVPAVPVATALTARGQGNQSVTVNLTAWQTLRLLDANGNPASTVTVTGGQYSVDGDEITFTPASGFHGEAAPVTFRVSDTYNQKTDSTFTPTIVPAAPVAVDRASRGQGNRVVTVHTESWQTLGLRDADGNPAATVTVADGTYSVDGNEITFTPKAGFHGEADPVTYRITDPYGQSVDARFSPTVLPDAPVGSALTARGHGSPDVTVPLTGWQLLRLLDADGQLATSVTVANGTYTVTDARITFTPKAGFHGEADPVTYRIVDLYLQRFDSTFTPTVLPAEPEASAETSRGHGDRTVTVPLKAWQTLRLLDADGNPASTVTVTGGRYSVDGDEITFTPQAGFHGEATPATYRVSDPYNQKADATFTPTVIATAPTATAKTARGHGNRVVTIDLEAWQTLRLLDAAGDPATRVSVTGGTYSVDGDEITFTPDAGFRGTPDAVTFRISDTYGQSDEATFTPTVVPAAPQAADLTSRGHGEQQVTVTHQAWQNLEILDADGQPAGTVRVDAGTYTVDGDVITFTPKAGYHGRVTSLTFRVTDGFSQEVRASYTPTVIATAPSVTDLTSRQEGQQGVAVPLELWQQLTLLDGTTPVTALRVPQGTYSIDGTAITFTPEMGVHGAADPVTFRVSDVYGQSDEGTYTPTVLPIAPTAGTLTSSGTGVQSVVPDVMAWQTLTLTDAQGDPVTTVSNASGTYTLDAQGTITFSPATGFVGAAQPVTFEIADGYGRSARGTWTPTVVAVPDPPVVVPPAGLAGTLKVTEKSGVVRSSVHRAKAPAKLTTRCVPSTGTATRCSVTLTATVKGKRVKVGSGKADGGKVVVKLTARGRALVARPGGVRVKAVMAVRTQDGQRATDTKKFTLVSKRFTVSRTVKFSSAGSTVSKKDAAWLRSVRSRTAGVRTVICTGYTDSTGNRTSNKALARARAAAVCGKLALPRRITVVVKSGGQGSPVASNATARGRAENRRVEITFVQ